MVLGSAADRPNALSKSPWRRTKSKLSAFQFVSSDLIHVPWPFTPRSSVIASRWPHKLKEAARCAWAAS
jgi:hypothetical protein